MLGTIKSSTEISHIFSKGRRYDSPAVTLLALRDEERGRNGRVAFIAGKKNGNAVWRNSAKRRLRAVCHEIGGPWPGYDVIFIAKRNIMRTAYSKVLKACTKLVEEALSESCEK